MSHRSRMFQGMWSQQPVIAPWLHLKLTYWVITTASQCIYYNCNIVGMNLKHWVIME